MTDTLEPWACSCPTAHTVACRKRKSRARASQPSFFDLPFPDSRNKNTTTQGAIKVTNLETGEVTYEPPYTSRQMVKIDKEADWASGTISQKALRRIRIKQLNKYLAAKGSPELDPDIAERHQEDDEDYALSSLFGDDTAFDQSPTEPATRGLDPEV